MNKATFHCSNCGAIVNENFKYCTSCGHELTKLSFNNAVTNKEEGRRVNDQTKQMLEELKSLRRGSNFRTIVIVFFLIIVFLFIYAGCQQRNYDLFRSTSF